MTQLGLTSPGGPVDTEDVPTTFIPSPSALDAWDVAFDVALEATTVARARGDFSNALAYGRVLDALGPEVARTADVTSAIITAIETVAARRVLARQMAGGVTL